MTEIQNMSITCAWDPSGFLLDEDRSALLVFFHCIDADVVLNPRHQVTECYRGGSVRQGALIEDFPPAAPLPSLREHRESSDVRRRKFSRGQTVTFLVHWPCPRANPLSTTLAVMGLLGMLPSRSTPPPAPALASTSRPQTALDW